MSTDVRAQALLILRTYRHMTQRELAGRAGTHHVTISAYERGRQEIGAANLRRLLEALDVPFRAWSDTLGHVDRLNWLTTRQAVFEERPEHLQGLQREVDALALTIGHCRERQAADLLDVALDLLGELYALRDKLARHQGVEEG